MPVTAILNLRAATRGPVKRSFHCLTHPIFLDRLSKADPDMSARLHNAGTHAPYSISPVMGVKGRVEENRSYWVRFGLFQNEMEEAFLKTMENGAWQSPVPLESHLFHVESILWGKGEEHPWANGETFEDLVARFAPRGKEKLTIASPMAFKRGDVHYPLPEPAMIFQNLLRRWNAASPFPLDAQRLDFSRVTFSKLNIRTEPFALRNGGTIVGCRGRLSFLTSQCSEEIRFVCGVLLRFAFYAGIGVKTTQGTGMARVEEESVRNSKQRA